MVGGEESWSLLDDFTTPGRPQNDSRRETATDPGWRVSRISNTLQPPDPGGGVLLTTARTKTLAQEPVEQPVPRSAHRRSTRQS